MKSQSYHMPTSECILQVIYSNICHGGIVIYIIFNEQWPDTCCNKFRSNLNFLANLSQKIQGPTNKIMTKVGLLSQSE